MTPCVISKCAGRRLIAPNGDVTLLGVSLDVTERRLAESALRASEERYRSLTEALPQLVWTCLPDGRCNYLSKQWTDFTGMGREQQLDLNWLELAVPACGRPRTHTRTLARCRGRPSPV